MNIPLPTNRHNSYNHFLATIKERIRETQYKALKTVNKELIGLYWEIGKLITRRQDWGKSIVENLSRDLQIEFPGIQGFSPRNLWNMKKFFLAYHHNQKLQPVVAEIPWTHNLVILEKCKDELQREFYLKMVQKYHWTRAVLLDKIDIQSYELFLLNQTNFDRSVDENRRYPAKLAVKDSYTFDFLAMGSDYKEKEFELAILKNIRKFLSAMGDDYAFIANQYKLTVAGDDFYIDLLLYHRKLQCLVAIEVKNGKFKPADAGQLQFYLTALNEEVKHKNENPAIGILICREKNRTVVEYALKNSDSPIGVASYNVSKRLPKEMRKLLPSKTEIEKSLESILD